MKRKALLSLFALIAVFSCIAFTPEAGKAEYPDKIIEFVIHNSAGSGGDSFYRTVAHFMNDEGIVKPKIQVFNRPGGGATVAINYLASKKGDPYVLLGWTTSPIMTLLRGTTTVKNVMDLTMICSLVEDPNMLVVRADSKYKSLKELIDDARKNPDRVKGSVGTLGGSEHVIKIRVQMATGVRFNITAFVGSSFIPVLGGHTDFAFAPLADVQENVKAGKLRYLANAGDTRSQAVPDLPTMKELGVNTSFRQMRGFWGPPEMPDYAVKFWGQAFAKLSETKIFKDYARKASMEPDYIGPEQLRKLMPAYAKEFAEDVKNIEAYVKK